MIVVITKNLALRSVIEKVLPTFLFLSLIFTQSCSRVINERKTIVNVATNVCYADSTNYLKLYCAFKQYVDTLTIVKANYIVIKPSNESYSVSYKNAKGDWIKYSIPDTSIAYLLNHKYVDKTIITKDIIFFNIDYIHFQYLNNIKPKMPTGFWLLYCYNDCYDTGRLQEWAKNYTKLKKATWANIYSQHFAFMGEYIK